MAFNYLFLHMRRTKLLYKDKLKKTHFSISNQVEKVIYNK